MTLLIKSNEKKPNKADTLNYLGFTTRKLGDYEGGEKYYRDHKKVMESLTYQFKTDINKLNDMDVTFDSLLEAEDNNHPLIIKLWMQEEILLETVVILDSILGFVERENKKITDTIIWPDIYRKIMKYKPFVKFDRNKCLNLLKETFTNAT